MARKYTAVLLGLLLMGGIVAVQDAAGISKSSKSSAPHRNSAAADNHRTSQLVLRSSCALVEDQRTGEFLVQKNARATVPIASITKLMTAMVVLDARTDFQQSPSSNVKTWTPCATAVPGCLWDRASHAGTPCCWL